MLDDFYKERSGLLNTLGYDFRDVSLFCKAMTHPSVYVDKSDAGVLYGYERLEFVGDAALSLLVAESLYNNKVIGDEGNLSMWHNYLVSGDVVAGVAVSIDLGSYLHMSSGEEKIGGRSNKNNLENAMEALIGAIYLDGGLDVLRKFVKKYWISRVDDVEAPPISPKSALQEMLQSAGYGVPAYDTINIGGTAHDPIFQSTITIDERFCAGVDVSVAKGHNKKEAESAAALDMIKRIRHAKA